MVYRFSDKKTGSGISLNEQLAEELHKHKFHNLHITLKEENSMRGLKAIFGQ